MTTRKANVGFHDAEEKKDDGMCVSPQIEDANLKMTIAQAKSDGVKQEGKPHVQRKSFALTRIGSMLRLLLLDVPLLITFALFLTGSSLQKIERNFLWKQLELMRWTPDQASTALTYFHRKIGVEDVTASDTSEFVVDKDTMDLDDIENLMLKHGAAIFPNLISPETANEVRNFILKQNEKNEDMIPVIENQNRWSFGVRVDQDPSVPKALKEILNKPHLVAALERIVGPDPAVIEFTGITAAYGAGVQRWHQDVVPDGNGAKYGRNFVPSYSLFIPLQNTTAAMGATGLCPGTALAGSSDDFSHCDQLGFQASGKNDNWPLGWGALVNQMTTHRGEAHNDPYGPHRVLFILTFAPRPRWGEKQVETRMIGQGGSYSLHWSQWGHTLSDFQDPEKYMRQPWRLLRSFGVYKPAGRRWGWDYVTQISARIINEEQSASDLVSMVERRGMKIIPEFLQGTFDLSSEESTVWADFASSTLQRCTSAAKMLYTGFIAFYLIAVTICILLSRKQRRFNSFVKNTIRVAVIHCVVLLAATSIMSKIESRSWAKNISAGRSFTLPKVWNGSPDLPSTLPRNQDVIIADHLHSDYLASFKRILDVGHPGNAKWKTMVKSAATGYRKLSTGIQKQLCSKMMLFLSREMRGTYLIKNQYGDWSPLPENMALRQCHMDLLKGDDKFAAKALEVIDFLRSESRFGYWRSSALSRSHVLGLFQSMEDSILGWDDEAHSKNLGHGIAILPGRLTVPKRRAVRNVSSQRVKTPYEKNAAAPVESARAMVWFREGDIVEAAYDLRMTEWYRAEITAANGDSYTWNVLFADGEEKLYTCAYCIRPFVQYAVGELIECRVQGVYYDCRVNKQLPYDAFEVTMIDFNERRQISIGDLRRYEQPPPLEVNERVSAQFPGDPSGAFYEGYIVTVKSDGTYAIQYDDGDYADEVSATSIRRL